MNNLDYKSIGLKAPTKIAKMHTGSASTNYYIQNEDGEFLIKLIKKSSQQSKDRLLANLKHTKSCKEGPCFLFEKELPSHFALVFKWIKGESCFLETLPSAEFKNLIRTHLAFCKLINSKKSTNILPAVDIKKLYSMIKRPPFFIRKDLDAIQQDLSYHPRKQIIHGDFHFKNILFKNNKLQSFLDFAEFRYGCPTEDLMRLLITNAEQHNFFRTSYTVKLLRTMIKEMPYSKQDWLHGLDVFVLTKYEKRLRKHSLRQWIMLLRCNFLYRKLRRTICDCFSNGSKKSK